MWFLRSLYSFAWAIGKLAWNGFRFVPKEIARDRHEICLECEHYNADSISCGICGCGLAADVGGWRRVWEKVHHPDERCPVGKWHAAPRL